MLVLSHRPPLEQLADYSALDLSLEAIQFTSRFILNEIVLVSNSICMSIGGLLALGRFVVGLNVEVDE